MSPKTMKNKRNFGLIALMLMVSNAIGAESWVKTDATKLRTGDVVVIVDLNSSTALPNNNGATSAPTAIPVTLNEGQSSLELFNKAIAKNVAFVPGDPFYVNEHNVNTLRLNYTNATQERIEEGIKRLADTIKEN